MRTKKRKTGKHWRSFFRWCGLAALILLALLILDYWAYPYGVAPGGKSFNRGENGLWLRYTWYFGKQPASAVPTLARQLRERQIRYAYFHVRSIQASGKLAFHYPEKAQKLVKTLYQHAPDVQAIAWVYAGNARGKGSVRLGDERVRKTMIAEARWLVEVCGFDGIQWDYETCDDGDGDFLALLRETKAALPKNKILSIASPIWMPFHQWGWSESYFSRVAEYCDQIAVMGYDTGSYFPRSYVWLMRQQALRIPQAAARTNPQCRVLFGLPTYGAGLPSHNPRSENITFALRGIREGLAASQPTPANFAGVALFAEYTTGANEWKTYHDLWLAK